MSCDHNAESLANIDGLYSYALVLTCDHPKAEELVEETYVRAMRVSSSLEGGSNLKVWLFTILRNAWLNQVMSRRSGPQFAGNVDCNGVVDAIGEPSKYAHDIYLSKMETNRIQGAIQKLPLEFREIIVLREYEGLSYREIASVMKCPAGTVISRLARARRKLCMLLSETIELSEPT
jgi:RNA polymerase sigma-70 factor (ECF subfamily)